MSWEFKVGQKVVCIKAGFTHPNWAFVPSRPKHGEVYTIRKMGECEFLDGVFSAIWLEEIRNAPRLWSNDRTYEIGFGVHRFRPLVTDTQSWLREVLETPPEQKIPEYVEIDCENNLIGVETRL